MGDLKHSLVRWAMHAQGVAEIILDDPEHRNTFSAAVVDGLRDGFQKLSQDPTCRVIILTGSGSYFASGGSVEQLKQIQRGELSGHSVLETMRIIGDCELPVIAAMQGHAFGGGLAFGLFADFIILAEESRYTANFMKLGFTPGAGASILLPYRFGKVLGQEMLFTARSYSGRELARREIEHPVVPRSEVLAHARRLAKDMSAAPRQALIELKKLLSAEWREAFEKGIAGELEAFSATVTSGEVARRLSASEKTVGEGMDSEDILLRLQAGKISVDEAEALLLVTALPGPSASDPSASDPSVSEPPVSQPAVSESAQVALEPSSTETFIPPRWTGASEQESTSDQVAIVGMACRFPGAKNWREFWKNLVNGVDSVTPAPEDRWPIKSGPGKSWWSPDRSQIGTAHSKWGGFLDDVDAFDASFFGISPAEAEIMDPQQRIFLEEAYHAIEDAGYSADEMRGQRCGVFVGAAASDYDEVLADADLETSRFTMTGLMASLLASRISYFLDLKGPALSIDTACSSSLVAFHQACESLRSGEIDFALVGGVTLLLTPLYQIRASQFQMLSAEGRCRTFDASASGIVLSEGCGVVLLRRASQAIENRDSIYALVRGSGINQDGSTNGITAPSASSQASLMRSIYERFSIDPGTIGYVEAHGTGTPLGDPIEVSALSKVFSESKSRQDCAIGSLKTNIGHTQLAAGIAGVIKAALCIHHGQLVPSLHFDHPNPEIDFENTPFHVNTTHQKWPQIGEQPRRAAVSSFGFSGTNAHAVLESPPEVSRGDSAPRTFHLLTLSAHSKPALKDLAENYRDALQTTEGHSLADFCHTSRAGRKHFPHRLAMVAETSQEAQEALERRLNDDLLWLPKHRTRSTPKIAFLFTGQGAQYPKMGRELYETQSVFREALQTCDQILEPFLQPSLLSVLFAEDPRTSALLSQTAYTQPATFALQYALVALWRSWGIEADFVMGHSVGEYMAAWVAGVFSLEDGLRLIASRGRRMEQCEPGVMAAIMADEAEAEELISQTRGEISIAAVNGPRNVVLSGKAEFLDPLLAEWKAAGGRSHRLDVSHAFHSPCMDPMLGAFAQEARTVRFSAPDRPLISNVTGLPVGDEVADPAYWALHARQPVRFADGVRALGEMTRGESEAAPAPIFLEIGPSNTLSKMVRSNFIAKSNPPCLLSSLQGGREDSRVMLESLTEWYERGGDVNWTEFDAPYQHRRVSLPGYPFRAERHWPKPAERPAVSTSADGSTGLGKNKQEHPLLGSRLEDAAAQQVIWQSKIGQRQLKDLAGHRVQGSAVLPASAFIEMAVSAAREVFGDSFDALSNLELHHPFRIPEQGLRTVKTVLPLDRDSKLEIYSRPSETEPTRWVLHASTSISRSGESRNGTLRNRVSRNVVAGKSVSESLSEGALP